MGEEAPALPALAYVTFYLCLWQQMGKEHNKAHVSSPLMEPPAPPSLHLENRIVSESDVRGPYCLFLLMGLSVLT